MLAKSNKIKLMTVVITLLIICTSIAVGKDNIMSIAMEKRNQEKGCIKEYANNCPYC